MTSFPVTPLHYFNGTQIYAEPMNKREEVCKQSLAYAVLNHFRNKKRLSDIEASANSFNGLINEKKYQFYNKTYGKDNTAKYVDWRLGRTKIMLQLGEFLKRPLPVTVYSINKQGMMERLDDFYRQIGMKHSAEQIKQLRKVAGMKVMGGMPIPEESDEQLWEKANARTQNEIVMNLIVKKLIELESVKSKASLEFLEMLLCSECFAKAEIDNNGVTRYRNISARFAMYEENENDPFLEKSPYMGEVRPMFEHDVHLNFRLDKDQHAEVAKMFNEGFTDNSIRMFGDRLDYSPYQHIGGNKCIDTYTIEFLAVKPLRYRVTEKDGVTYRNQMSEKWFNENQDVLDWEKRKGKSQVEEVPKIVVWEASLIGDRVFCQMEEKKNRIGNLQNPYETEMSYGGIVFMRVNGTSVSTQKLLDETSHLYNIVMWQMRRELYKAKGKVIPYNRAWLPKGYNMNTVNQRMINDGTYEYDTTRDPDSQKTEQAMRVMLNSIDMGVSQTMSVLIELKRELERTADRLTGINDDREGNTPASSTATSAMANAENSRSITEAQFFFFYQHLQRMVKKLMEYGKISYGILRPDLGATTLGPEAMKFLDKIQGISNDTFNVYLGDPGKDYSIKEKLERWTELAINAKEMRIVDAAKAQMSETANDAVAVLEQGWDTMRKVTREDQQAAVQNNQDNLAAKSLMMKEDREDKQRHEIDVTIIDGLIKAGLLTQEAANQFLNDMNAAMMEQGEIDAAQKAQGII